MTEQPRTTRPGGRTARTRTAVCDAVRELLDEPAAELSIPTVAARSGVHATTIYRRWGTIEALLLDIAVEDVRAASPIRVTGDLAADLTAYVRHLLESIQRRGRSAFLQVLLTAARQDSDTAPSLLPIVQPRLDEFQALLDAAGVTGVGAMRMVEILIAPAYFWAQLGAPLDPERDTGRLVETALLACRDDHQRRRGS